jgi:hypothetical protein
METSSSIHSDQPLLTMTPLEVDVHEHGAARDGLLRAALGQNKPATSPFSNSTIDFPSVFEEANEMILASIIVYGVVDLRAVARKGLFLTDGVDNLLTLPISAADIVRLVSQNRTVIQDEIGEESTELYLGAFDSFVEDDTFELDYNTETGETSLASFDVVDVGDEFSDRELVYGICVHSARKRITVAFRGATTRKDWQVSADPFLTSRDNPVTATASAAGENDPLSPIQCNASCSPTMCNAVMAGNSEEEQIEELDDSQRRSSPTAGGRYPRRISIHRGFYNYLFHRSGTDGTNKYETIMNKVLLLQKQYPGYSVYVSGHSLGGGLAILFAFYAAASGQLGDDPVTCIPIASPMVGNLSFEQAFKTLERQGRVRCLRITNHFDIFTQLPDRATLLYAVFCWGFHLFYLMGATFLFFLCCQNNVYRHVGMDLHLYGSGRYKIKHTRGSANNYCWRVCQDLKRHWKQTLQRIMTVPFVWCCDCFCCKEDFNRNHTIQEHRARLNALSSTELRGLYLNDLYGEKRFDLVTPV